MYGIFYSSFLCLMAFLFGGVVYGFGMVMSEFSIEVMRYDFMNFS